MFAELLACSNFSFLHGASHPEEMVETAHALGLSAIGICDRHGLYGSVRAFVRARELGIKLIVGTELEVKWRDLLSVSAQPRLALLVEDAQGYRNLCRLLTLAHRDAPKGQAILRLDTLRYEDFTGLIALVPADSLLVLDAAQQVHESATRQRQAWLARLHELFTQRLYLLAYRHWDATQSLREQALLDGQQRLGLAVVASARPRMHVAERKALADVLECIRRGTTVQAAGTQLLANCEARLLPEAEMRLRFRDHLDWVEQTHAVASLVRFDLGSLNYYFPCALEPGETADEKLARLTWQGAERRYPAGTPAAVKAQIDRELILIAQMGMASYF